MIAISLWEEKKKKRNQAKILKVFMYFADIKQNPYQQKKNIKWLQYIYIFYTVSSH